MKIIVPLGTAQVGCIVLATVGTLGAPGATSIVTVLTALLIQVLSLVLLTLKVYVAGAKPLKVLLAWYAPPMLYSTPA